MECLVVTHAEEGQWLVSQEGRTLASCPSEEKALLVTFALASKYRRLGIRAVIISKEARDERSDGAARALKRPVRTWSAAVSR